MNATTKTVAEMTEELRTIQEKRLAILGRAARLKPCKRAALKAESAKLAARAEEILAALKETK